MDAGYNIRTAESSKVADGFGARRKYFQKENLAMDKQDGATRAREASVAHSPIELKKRLEKDNLSGHIVGIEPAGKMTDPQIVAKVRGQILDQSAATDSK